MATSSCGYCVSLLGVVVCGMAVAAFRFYLAQGYQVTQAWTCLIGIIGSGLLIVATDILAHNKQITTLSAIYFGLLLGLLLGNMLYAAF